MNIKRKRTPANENGITYAELGVITALPKRYEYALEAKRLETLGSWPRDHPLKPEDLAAAGFYYAGYGDCARCFYCGGGLRNWEDADDVFVEHARWFPKCAFIHQIMGPTFVATVQKLNEDFNDIPYSLVIENMPGGISTLRQNVKENPLAKDPAVLTMIEHTAYPEKDILGAAESIKKSGSAMSVDAIIDYLQGRQVESQAANTLVSNLVVAEKDRAAIREIKEKNSQLRRQTVCTICMDREVSIVNLPCGHLVTCVECNLASRDCPICRATIRGVVRAFLP